MIFQISLLLRLLIAHFLGDFLFQTSNVVNQKQAKRWKSEWLYGHALIYALFIYVASSLWNQVFLLLPIAFISHLFIDRFKVSLRNNTKNFLLDQLAHLFIIVAIWIILSSDSILLINSIIIDNWNSPKILLIFLGYLLVLWPYGFLIGYTTAPFRKELTKSYTGLEKAGYWIGMLERFLIYSFILSGYTEAIGLLVVAKSIFRFGEIKDPEKRKEAEYILIGSLFSFGLAMTTGYIIKLLIK